MPYKYVTPQQFYCGRSHLPHTTATFPPTQHSSERTHASEHVLRMYMRKTQQRPIASGVVGGGASVVVFGRWLRSLRCAALRRVRVLRERDVATTLFSCFGVLLSLFPLPAVLYSVASCVARTKEARVSFTLAAQASRNLTSSGTVVSRPRYTTSRRAVQHVNSQIHWNFYADYRGRESGVCVSAYVLSIVCIACAKEKGWTQSACLPIMCRSRCN